MPAADSTILPNLPSRLLDLIRERILDLPENFTPIDNLYEAGLDSMAIMQLLLVVEEEFHVSIPVESVSKHNLSSVNSLAALIDSKSNPDTPATSSPPPVKESSPLPLPQESSTPTDFQNLPMSGSDYFVLSFDRLSRKTGQGGHKAHSFLLLDKLPDIPRLRDALQQAAEKYPMLNAVLRKRLLPGVPSWTPAQISPAPPLDLFSEQNSLGILLPLGAQTFTNAHQLMEQITNEPMPEMKNTAWNKARFSLLELGDGSAVLIFSWSHLMMDGVGAEWFLKELNNIYLATSHPHTPAFDPSASTQSDGAYAAWQRTGPMIDFFRNLSRQPITCLGPEKPLPGKTHFLVKTLTTEQTAAVNARCASLCGDIVNMPFYLAAAMRAHDVIFQRRNNVPPAQVCAVPIQTRRKGSLGPIFLNHITIFFGTLLKKDTATIQSATAALMKQHQHFLKAGLGESFKDLMHLMSYIPAPLYMAFMKFQMRGPFSSLFHSHTGEFAEDLSAFCDAKITNAFHIPGIGTPPGTGIFCNEKNGRLVITMCWHESALDEAERSIMLNHFLSDLGAQ